MITEESTADILSLPAQDQFDRVFVNDLIDKVMIFMDYLTQNKLHGYQIPLARRIIESVIIKDGEVLTALAARQSGKTEIIANVCSTLMVLLPKLAPMYPKLLDRFHKGIMIGIFAPVEGQVETVFNRIVERLSSKHAISVLADPDIDDVPTKPSGVVKTLKLKNSGSSVMMMTANPRAKIESKSFHLIIIDECQDADDHVVTKSITPMRAYYAGTVVKTGTPSVTKNNFYSSIQLNKRLQSASRKARQNHFEWNWKEVVKWNPDYLLTIRGEILRIGEDSDEFQMSFNCKWLLERGMFITSTQVDELGDVSQEVVRNWYKSPVIVGIDPARKTDSTVVTVVWVDWDRPDEAGYYDHRVLNWLELQGDDWEEQYFQIVQFLSAYDVLAVGIDANGVGDVVMQRLKLLLPKSDIVGVSSSQQEQTKRWQHLQALIQRKAIGWPSHAKTRRLRTWKRFTQQLVDAEKTFSGPHMRVEAPDEAHAHDDYVDSLAIACSLTQEMVMPTIEVGSADAFYRKR